MQLRDSERCSLTDPLLFDHRIDFLKLARKVVIVPSEASTWTCEFKTLKEPLRRRRMLFPRGLPTLSPTACEVPGRLLSQAVALRRVSSCDYQHENS